MRLPSKQARFATALAWELLLCQLAATAAAQQSTSQAPNLSLREELALRRACENDYNTYCEGVKAGGGRILACLAKNEARLSPSCKNALAKAGVGR